MIKQLQKVGNSAALVLDKPVLDLLGVEKGAKVRLTIEGGTLLVTPVSPAAVDRKRFEAALKAFTTERRRVLRKLAK